MNEPYPILVLEHANGFHCIVKELSIIESGQDLIKTYEKAQAKKKSILADFKQAGLEGMLVPKPEKKKKMGLSLNFVLLALFLMVPLTSLTLPATRILKKACKIFEQPLELVMDLGKRVEEMPNEKKKELKHSIQTLIAQFDTENQNFLEDSTF